MARRRTHRRTCTHTGCPAYSDIEYTARHELATIKPTWTCRKHDKPNEHLTASNRETSTTLELHPRYRTGSRYVAGIGYTDEPVLLGLFWGPEGLPDKAHHGIESGPGFWADAKEFPPGTRLVVTARIELPAEDQAAP